MKMTENKNPLYVIFAFIGVMCEFVGINPLVLGVLTGSFVLDFLTGITKSWVSGTYKSKIGWVKTIAKILGILLIGLMALTMKLLGIPHSYFLMSSFMILALHDLISSVSNLYTIRTGKELEEFDAISLLIRNLHKKLIGLVKKILNDNNK
jgi:phage-related holin